MYNKIRIFLFFLSFFFCPEIDKKQRKDKISTVTGEGQWQFQQIEDDGCGRLEGDCRSGG